MGHAHIPTSRTGEVGTTPPGSVSSGPQATVGGEPAEIRYAGQAPTLLAGVTQVNFMIPEDAPTGSEIPLEVRFGSLNRSQPNLTLAIE